MELKFYWSIGIIAIFISGCIQQFPEGQLIRANLDSSFQLKIGQTGFIESENLKIKFLNVTEDSRCPSDGVCVWAGRAVIVVNVLMNGQYLGDFNLTEYGNEVNFGSYSIKLLKIDPYPKNWERRISISDYTVNLIVSRYNFS